MPFPINSLPPIIKDAVNEVYKNTQAPIPLIAVSALGAISLVCQQQVNVSRIKQSNGPSSLFFLTLAESGERKSTVDNLFMQPVHAMEEKLNKQYQIDMASYHQEKRIFNTKLKALEKMMAADIRKGNDTATSDAQLRELLSTEPKEPTRYKFCFNDATPAAMKSYLSQGWNSIGLISDEAAIIFDGHALNELGFINKMWDGAPISVSRKSENDYEIQGGRMTISLMVQPTVLFQFLDKKGEKARDIGFLARCFICYPESTQGFRQIESTTVYSEHLTYFNQRLTQILSSSIEDHRQGVDNKRTLRLSTDAEQKWIEIYNEIETNLQESGSLYYHKEFGAKMAENLIRLAALLHFFSHDSDLISLESLLSASHLVYWFYHEQLRLFPQSNEVSEAEYDANTLLEWIDSYAKKHGSLKISKTYILQYGPNKLRNSSKLNIALNILQKESKILIQKENKKNYIYTSIPIDHPISNLKMDLNLKPKEIDTNNKGIMQVLGELNKGKPDLTVK